MTEVLLLGSLHGYLISFLLINFVSRNKRIFIQLPVILFYIFILASFSTFESSLFIFALNTAFLLTGPALFFSQRQNKIRISDAVHLIPYMLFLVIELLNSMTDISMLSTITFNQYANVLKSLILIFYSIHFFMSIDIKKRLPDFIIETKFVSLFVYLSLLIFLTSIFAFLGSPHLSDVGLEMELSIDQVMSIYLVFLCYIKLIKMIRTQTLISTHTKYKTSPLTTERKHSIVETITALMEDQQLFLDPDLDLKKLEKISMIKEYFISQTLNEIVGKNFYDFVNSYRIKMFLSKLNDDNQAYKTFIALAFESGFNSKTAFNRIFKEQMGVTPSEYKAALNKSVS